MGMINNINNIEGKTIKNAMFDTCDELLCIRFEDNTYIVVEMDRYGESTDLRLSDAISYREKEEFDLLSKDEVIVEKKRIDAREKEREEYLYNDEIEMLLRLKAKHPNI